MRVFSNYYGMAPHTYLPSYHRTEAKAATLLCAEIADFHHVSDVLHRYTPPRGTKDFLRDLVNLFVRTASSTIEDNRGRVDQIWGNGLVAVFGEYLDTPALSPVPGCKRAVIAAADLVERFNEAAARWLKDEFHNDQFVQSHYEHLSVRPAVAVHHGDVVFDYVGSARRQVYIALGDNVDFVKQLGAVAGRQQRHTPGNHGSATADGQVCWLDDFYGPPILLSQSAYSLSNDMLKSRNGEPSESVHRPQLVLIPGRPREYKVFPIWSDQVIRVTTRSVSRGA